MQCRHPFSAAIVAAVIASQLAPSLAFAVGPGSGRAYLGKPRDPAFGFQDLGNRWYDPSSQRFLSPDPVFWEVGRGTEAAQRIVHSSQAQNPTSYAAGNPVRFLDGDGLEVREFQPYEPKGSTYRQGDRLGTYRGSIDVRSAGTQTGSGVHPYQCTDLAKDFSKRQYSVNLAGTGNGVDYADQQKVNAALRQRNPDASGSYEVHRNGGPDMPQEDDLISWAGGEYGHVGVVAEVVFDPSAGTGYVHTVEQNASRGQAVFEYPLTRTTGEDGNTTYAVGSRQGFSGYQVQGWARYVNQSQDPKVQPRYTTTLHTPAPQPAKPQPVRR